MEKSNQIGAIILGAAAAFALYKYSQMSKEERSELFADIKEKTQMLLEDTDSTVEKVQHYVGQMKGKGPDEWFDKLYLLKRMFSEFYGGGKKQNAHYQTPGTQTLQAVNS